RSDLMTEHQDSQWLPHQRNQHECWAAMKTAYEEYRMASTILDSMMQMEEDGDAPTVTGTDFRAQQRTFERYVEARMDFVDCCVDRATPPIVDCTPPVEMSVPEPTKKKYFGVRWPPVAIAMPVVRGLSLTLLCATALSVILQQRHTRDLQTGLLELQGSIDRVGEALLAWQAVQRQVGDAAPVQPVQPPRAMESRAATVTKVQTPRQTRERAAYYRFALSRPHQFKSVGPLRVTLIG